MKAYFISDIHLKDSHEPSSQSLLGFLIQLEKAIGTKDPFTHLFLVGDIFDLWIGSHQFFIEKFQAIVEQLKILRQLGIEIHYFEGNHDLYLKDFWQEKLGIKVHAKDAVFQLGSFKVRVEHGDLINPEDKGYLFLYRFLRMRPISWLAKKLPSSLVKFIGTKASQTSRNFTSTAKHIPDDKIRELIRLHVLSLKDHNFDLIVSGHVHVRDDQSFLKESVLVRSINLGSWFDQPKCFVLSETEARFYQIKEDGTLEKSL